MMRRWKRLTRLRDVNHVRDEREAFQAELRDVCLEKHVDLLCEGVCMCLKVCERKIIRAQSQIRSG